MSKKFVLYTELSPENNKNLMRLVSIVVLATNSRIEGFDYDIVTDVTKIVTDQEVVNALLVLFPTLQAEENLTMTPLGQ